MGWTWHNDDHAFFDLGQRSAPCLVQGEDSLTAAIAVQDGPEATGTSEARPHFAGFEILRAVSSLMIVAHHAGALAGPERTGRAHVVLEVFDMGVPVFFVTSGFLIFRPLVSGHFTGQPGPRLLDFWWRRLLRVVPAYWLALTFWWKVGNFNLGDAWWRYYLFVQVYDRLTVIGGLVQAWTLAAEVAFYLSVPLWAMLLGKAARRLRTANQVLAFELAACGLLWAGAIIARAMVSRYAPTRTGVAFTWLPMNMDTFAWGMALAAVSVWSAQNAKVRATLDRWGRPVGLWWLAAIAVMVTYGISVGPQVGYSGWFWQRRQLVYLVVGLLAVFPAVFGPSNTGSLIRRYWRLSPFVWLGSISYGLYLWHFDIMKRAVQGYDYFYDYEMWPGWFDSRVGDSNFLHLYVLGMVAGLGFAAISWYGVEKPLSRFRRLFAATGSPR